MLLELLIIIAGLVFGSFITCASYRLPLELDIVKKPSYCPNCNAKLTIRDLFPVFSWLASGGKCRHCNVRISFRYPLIELCTAGLFLFLYASYGATIQFFILTMMVIMLLIMIITDLEHFIIPDSVHIILLPLAITYHYSNETLSIDVLWNFCILTSLALFLHYGYSKLRGRVMLGFGDVKFFAVVGLWLPLAVTPVFLLMSGILGVLLGLIWRVMGRGAVFPFGPALAVALFVCVLYPEHANVMHYLNQAYP